MEILHQLHININRIKAIIHFGFMDHLTLFLQSGDTILFTSFEKAWPCKEVKTKNSIKIYHQLWPEIVPISLRNNSAVSMHKVIGIYWERRTSGFVFFCLLFEPWDTLTHVANVNQAVLDYYYCQTHEANFQVPAVLALHIHPQNQIKMISFHFPPLP